MSLKVVKLSKRIKDKWVLRDISFEVSEGEVFGIFGAAGSGKTSLLDAIECGTANGGSVTWNDEDLAQSRSLVSRFRVSGTDGSIWKRWFAEKREHSLGDRLNQFLDGADGVLMFDDPLCGLDAATRETNISRIRTAAGHRKLSVLFASNDFGLILKLCDRAAVIIKGESQQTGTPQEIYERPVSRAVASLTGYNNLIAARRLTSSKAEVPEFHTIDGGHRLFAERVERGSLGALNQNVTLAIRPEQISISFGASFPADNLLKATVTGIRFLGPTTLVNLDAEGLKLDAMVLRVVGLAVGDKCMVGLPPERIIILRD